MSYGLLRNKKLFERFKNDEFRNEYVSSRIRSRMAVLIRTLRKARGWSQAELAQRANTKQSVISRIEDPDYEGTSLQSLFAIAGAFKLPLWVDMPEWTQWAVKSEELSSRQLQRRGFDELTSSDLMVPQFKFQVSNTSAPARAPMSEHERRNETMTTGTLDNSDDTFRSETYVN